MKTFFLILSTLLIFVSASGQVRQIESGASMSPGFPVMTGKPNMNNSLLQESSSGYPMELEVYSTDQVLSFSDARDYREPKVIPAYYKLRVKVPPVPWVITARLESSDGINSAPRSNNGKSIVSLRSQMGIVVPLSQAPQIILSGGSGLTEQYTTIDLIVEPPFNMSAGDLFGFVTFQLLLQ